MIVTSTRTLVIPMLWFLLIFLFRDASTIKRLTSNNQDIRARPLVLTTVALTNQCAIDGKTKDHDDVLQHHYGLPT
jgi:hypothetical protein